MLPGLLALALLPAAPSRAEEAREYDVKAVFIFNFLKFVDWPPSAFKDQDAAVVVGILGDDPFGAAFDRALADRKAHDRRIVVKRYATFEDFQSDAAGADTPACHLLFIGGSPERVSKVLQTLKKSATLTVGDSEEFAERGGIVGFYLSEGKVRFAVNPDAAKRAGLQISSQLLKLSKIVRDK
jgi:hypothetical protein